MKDALGQDIKLNDTVVVKSRGVLRKGTVHQIKNYMRRVWVGNERKYVPTTSIQVRFGGDAWGSSRVTFRNPKVILVIVTMETTLTHHENPK